MEAVRQARMHAVRVGIYREPPDDSVHTASPPLSGDELPLNAPESDGSFRSLVRPQGE